MTRRSCLSAAAAAALTAAALLGCSRTPDSAAPSTPTSASPAAPAIEGTWTTRPYGRAEIAQTLASAGLTKHLDAFLADDPAAGRGVVVTLRVGAGRWTAFRAAGTAEPELVDQESYTVDRDRLVLRADAGGTNTYRWAVREDVLRLEFVSSTEPDYRGMPNEVPQRALYTAAEFSRST